MKRRTESVFVGITYVLVSWVSILAASVLAAACSIDPAELAVDTAPNVCPEEIPRNPESAETAALSAIRASGYSIRTAELGDALARTNVGLRRVSLARDWHEVDVRHRATTAWHELAHIRTAAIFGIGSAILGASDDDMRAAYESIGFRQSLWTGSAIGFDDTEGQIERFEKYFETQTVGVEAILIEPDDSGCR